jgi:site-specific recombinase XerD
MDNATALQEFERSLRRRFPDRTTPVHYVSDVRQFQRGCIKPWAEVTRADVDAFVDGGQTQGWRPSTLARRVAALKAFFAFCADQSGPPDRPNPVQSERHAPRRGDRLPRDVSDETLDQLWRVIDQPRDQMWFTLMLRGGLRVGEVVTLRRQDIVAPATPERAARLRVMGKGRKERIVPLTADAYTVVARWLVEVPAAPDAPLCPNRHGKPMTVNGLQERLRHYCRKAGVRVTCHQLRHTYARQLVEHELPVATLAKLMGHTSISTTQVYLTGADPQVRRDYQQAMTRWTSDDPSPGTPSATELEPFPTAPPIAEPASPPPTPAVGRGQAFETWGDDLPAWVHDACLDYLRQRQKDWKPSRRGRNSARLLRALARFWRWQLARRPLTGCGDLTRADVQAYVDARLAEGRAPTTITNEVFPALGVLRLRQEQGDPVPDSVFRISWPKDRERLPRDLPEADARRLERHMSAYLSHDTPDCRRDAAVYFLLAHTGLRLSELVDLKRHDVDLAGRRLRIEDAKGRHDRVVCLSPTCVQALQRYLAGQPLAADAPLICHPTGQPVSYRWVQYQVHRWGEEAGVPAVSCHRLRHTFATRLVNLDVPITTIQRLLGHHDLRTTQRYAHVLDKTAQQQYHDAMVRIEQALSLAPVSLTALTSMPFPDRAPAVPVDVIKDPLDNSL